MGLLGAEPASLQPQQRRDGLEVVLHPVVDLADRGVLRQQDPVAATQVGDVADQDHRPGGPAPLEQRDGLDQHRGLAPLDLLGHRDPQPERGLGRVLVEADLPEEQPVGVGVDPEPVQRADGVRAREPDPELVVEEDHPVGDPGRLLDRDLVAGERERALGRSCGRTARTCRGRPARALLAGARRSSATRGTRPRSATRRAGGGCTRSGPARRSRARWRRRRRSRACATPGRRAAARPPRRRCRRARAGRGSGRSPGGRGRGRRTGGPPRLRPARGASRSAKHRSASGRQEATRRWRCRSAAAPQAGVGVPRGQRARRP